MTERFSKKILGDWIFFGLISPTREGGCGLKQSPIALDRKAVVRTGSYAELRTGDQRESMSRRSKAVPHSDGVSAWVLLG